MASSDILSIGQSALAAAQAGISTTGHNISNASTAGYSRQIVVQTTAGAQNFGYGFVGQGTQVASVQRVFNNLLASQVNAAQSSSSQINSYSSLMSQIDNMIGTSSSGVSTSLQSFFTSIQGLTTNPSDAATRQTMLSSAQSLANSFQNIGSTLTGLNNSVNSQISSTVTEINSYASQIAKLNQAITVAQSASGQPANDLLDQRDQLVSTLSQQVQVNVVSQNGSYSVFIGNGQPLVVGNSSYNLSAVTSASNPSQLDIALQSNGSTTTLASQNLSGGALGGLLQFRDQSLGPIENTFGQMALVVAQAFNNQQSQGLDLNGNQGSALFNMPGSTISANTNNTGTQGISATISNANAVTTSDYSLKYDGTNYTLTRLSDGTTNTYSSLPQTVDGLSISLSGAGTMKSGDSFLIQPTVNAASGLSVALTDINKIAAGGSVVTSTAASSNTGNATMSTPAVSSAYASSPLTTSFTLTYNQATNQLSGFPSGGPQSFVSGSTISVGNVSFTLSGTPANGDQFTIAPNATNATGSNTNALALAALQTSKLVGGSTSLSDTYAQLVSTVGNQMNQLNITGAAETAALTQLTNTQQSNSGVNLDEEATNLIRYQQAYQAAGRVMQVATQLFTTLLSIGT
jgi:flagellar hook-associated protein 1 FlgK